ncbi:MAG TPA: DUF2782 domain-containing protein [Xanthomonadaceae bacterium]|nr:DUF2782 domain-containing protein [Xanthomonadaceae bacterium]
MHASRHARLLLAASLLLALAACMTADPQAGVPEIPPGAIESVKTYDNGDVVTEYRVAGQLRVVRVQPPRGPAYYLYDRNGDGRLDASEGEGPVSPVYFKLYEW